MYSIYCVCSDNKTYFNEDCIVVFLPHVPTRNVWTIQGETFFPAQRTELFYLKIRNTTLASTAYGILKYFLSP